MNKIIIGTVLALFALTVEAAPAAPTNLRVVTPKQDQPTQKKKPAPDPYIANGKPTPDPYVINHRPTPNPYIVNQ